MPVLRLSQRLMSLRLKRRPPDRAERRAGIRLPPKIGGQAGGDPDQLHQFIRNVPNCSLTTWMSVL